jgi:hypothetical protein
LRHEEKKLKVEVDETHCICYGGGREGRREGWVANLSALKVPSRYQLVLPEVPYNEGTI